VGARPRSLKRSCYRADAVRMKTRFRDAKKSTKIATVIFWLLALYMLASFAIPH